MRLNLLPFRDFSFVAVNACIMGMSSIFGSPIGSFGAQFAATVCVGRTKRESSRDRRTY
jgi:hypothetical protein